VTEDGDLPAKPLPAPGSVGAWVLGIRPKTLTASTMPVVVGSSFAVNGHLFSWERAAAALVVGVGIQIGTNLVNDVADHLRGADTRERLGPPRVTNVGLLSPRAVIIGAATAFGLAGVCGLWLASISSWWVLVPGGAALLCGVVYTAGPAPIAYLGFGEAFVLGFFGVFATAGTAFVMLERWSSEAVVAGLAMGLLAVGLLEANNIRDIPTDEPTGKRTLAVRMGERPTRVMYAVVIAAAFVCAAFILPRPATVALVVLCGPIALLVIRPVLRGAEGRELVKVLQMNSLLELVFGVVLSVAIVAVTPHVMGPVK